MANFNKVVKVLNIKSAVSLQLTAMEKRNREFETTRMRCIEIISSSRQLEWYIECVVSISRLRSR